MKAAENGRAIAQNNLGMMYRYARGVKQDYKKALLWYEKAAQHENADSEQAEQKLGYRLALNNMAELYLKGLGVKQDPYKAVDLYIMAAEKGLLISKINLGFLFGNEGKFCFNQGDEEGKKHYLALSREWFQDRINASISNKP